MAHRPKEYSDRRVDGDTVKRAITDACKKAGLFLEQIGFISGFGCGIKEIDDGELEVYRELFGVNKSVLSVKAATGDARAASAAMALAQAAKVLHGDSDIVGKWYQITETGARESEAAAGEYALAVSYGAGGSCSAVIIKKV